MYHPVYCNSGISAFVDVRTFKLAGGCMCCHMAAMCRRMHVFLVCGARSDIKSLCQHVSARRCHASEAMPTLNGAVLRHCTGVSSNGTEYTEQSKKLFTIPCSMQL